MSLRGPSLPAIEWPIAPDIEMTMGDLTGTVPRWHTWDTDGFEAWPYLPPGPGDPQYLPAQLSLASFDLSLGWPYAVAMSIEVFWSSLTQDSGAFGFMFLPQFVNGMSISRFGETRTISLYSNNDTISATGLWDFDEWFKITYVLIGHSAAIACIDDVEVLSGKVWFSDPSQSTTPNYGYDIEHGWQINASLGAIQTDDDEGVHVRNFKGVTARLDPPWSHR